MAKKFGDLFGNMDDVFSGAKISNFDLDDMLSVPVPLRRKSAKEVRRLWSCPAKKWSVWI